MAATNINRVVLTGNLTRDPELRSTASGKAYCGSSSRPVLSSIDPPEAPASAVSRIVSATAAGASAKPFARSTLTGNVTADTIEATCASISSRVTP